jgi:hypothetical protein
MVRRCVDTFGMNKGARWLGAAAVIALASTACSPVKPGATSASTASANPVATASAPPSTPGATPSDLSGRSLALVTLRGSKQFVVLDATDLNHPTTVSTLAAGAQLFASRTEVSWVGGPTLFKMPFDGSPTVVVDPVHGLYFNSFAWNSNGTAVAYVTNVDQSQSQVRIVKDGQDRAIGSMPPLVPTHSCVYQSCADHADIRLLFSPNGAYISFVQNYGGPSLHVWTSDGALLKGIDSESAMMSVWSSSALYFRDESGVEMWRDGAQSRLLAGVAWIRPKASPSGGKIVYATRDVSGTAHVEVLDTSTGQTREIATSRSEPAFLNSHLIWYQEERSCLLTDPPPCGQGVATTGTGKTYTYDLQTGSEVESNVTTVWDVWPHPA